MPYPSVDPRRGRSLACLASLVLLLVYWHALGQIGSGHFLFGTPNPANSLRSLQHLLGYAPQSLVDAVGHPRLLGEIASWQGSSVLDPLHRLFEGRNAILALIRTENP